MLKPALNRICTPPYQSPYRPHRRVVSVTMSSITLPAGFGYVAATGNCLFFADMGLWMAGAYVAWDIKNTSSSPCSCGVMAGAPRLHGHGRYEGAQEVRVDVA